MATIHKRGANYRVLIRRKGFASESATFPIRAQAVEWAAMREAEIIGSRHGIIPRRTVRQAMERYRDEVSPAHRGARWEAIRINKLLREIPFADRLLSQVTPQDVASWRDAALTRLAPSSVLREYGLLKAIFTLAVREWGWLRESPFLRVSAPPSGAPRTRRVTDAEAAAITVALGYVRGTRPETYSQEIAVAFLLAIETMMRQGEILTLDAGQVYADASYLRLLRTKNGDERDVPLSPAALALLALLPAAGPLFGVSSRTCDTLFRRARDAAGIVGLRFHDSRREATTRLARKLDVLQLAKAGGWRDVNLLLKIYYSPSATDAAKLLL